MHARVVWLVAAAWLSACGGDDDRTGGMTDAGPTIPPASASPQVAFEGHRRMAVAITADGADLTGATVTPEDASGPLEVVDSRCNGTVCGVVIRVADTRPNMGQPIPAPIDAENHFLSVQKGEQRWRSLLSVRPLDAISNGGTTPLMVRGVQLASSVSAVSGSTFRAAPGSEPVRWVIFGGGEMHGTIDVSGESAEARAGGYAGGASGADGAGPAAGSAGSGGAGGGGAGGLVEGEAGQGADGTDGAGGAAGAASADVECAGDFTAPACGGSGGGGAGGAGGAGGGTLAIVSLEPLDLGGATLRAAGGEGADGGGGGAGGLVLVGAPSFAGSFAVDVAGGAGGAPAAAGGAGGTGAAGVARADLGAGELAGDAWVGPSVDLAAVPAITDAATLTLSGRAEPDATVDVADIDGGASASTTADATGAWSVEITLAPGLNRLGVTATGATGTARSWTGTNVEFRMVPGMLTPLPMGATVDVVYVP